MRFTLASERSRRRPSSAYVSPRARTLFFSASTKRLAAGMRPKVSDNATSQAPVAARFGLSEKCNREGERHDRQFIYPVVRSRARRGGARGRDLSSRAP